MAMAALIMIETVSVRPQITRKDVPNAAKIDADQRI